MLVSFERTLFYLMVVAITKKTVAFDNYRNQKYRDEHRTSQPFYKETKHKRAPICRFSSAHLLPHGVSDARPNRPGEGSLAPLGDVDRFKEVIHIPCPKRMSNSQGVAAFQGQQEFSASESTDDERVLRVAKDSRKYQEVSPPAKPNQSPSQPTDLNVAVKQNQQWLISSQGGAQQSAHYSEHTPLGQPTQYNHEQNRPTANVNQQQFTPDNNNNYMGQNWPNYVVPPIDRPSETMKAPQKQVNVNKYDQPSRQQQMDNRRIKMKFDGNQASSAPQTNQMTNSNGQYLSQHNMQKPQEAPPNNGLHQPPAMMYDVKTPPVLPPSRNEIVLPVQDSHQYPNNVHNLTYEPPNNFFQAVDSPYLLPPYSNSSYDPTSMSQQTLYPSNLANNTNLGVNYVFKQNNATMASGPPLNYGYNSARDQAIPGQQHNTYKYGNRQGIKGEMNKFNAVNVNSNQPPAQNLEIDSGNHLEVYGINHQQQFEHHKTKSEAENWKEFNKPQTDFSSDQNQRSSQTISNQVGNRDKTGNQVNPAHGLAAIKGFFGKHNKEEMKVRQSAGSEPKPPKSKGHNENLLPLSATNGPTGNDKIADKVCVGKNERALINGKSGLIVVVEKANGYDNSKNNIPTKTNSVIKNDHYYNPVEVIELPRSHDAPVSMAAFPQQLVTNSNLLSEAQNYRVVGTVLQRKQGNVSRSLSHILSPPMTVEPHMFTNKGVKVISKVPYNEDATYHPFMGFAPARNDEAFYDKKNLNFLGPIDHPPLINHKRNKARKQDKRMKAINKNFKRVSGKFRDEFYSEPADFHSDMIAEDLPQSRKGAKRVRYVRRCQQSHKTFWQHIKGQNRRGLHRSKESPLRSGP